MEEEILESIETEHGNFTEDKEHGLTAQGYYINWLSGLNAPPIQEPNKTEILEANVLNLQKLCIGLQKQIILK